MKFLLLCALLFPLTLPLAAGAAPAAANPEAAHRAALQPFAGEANPWGAVDPELFTEYIAPLTSLGETPVAWLETLQPLARELTAGATTPLEAAMLLNRHLWKRINVIYSTKREKANQDPLHSMRLGLASCSGLSILLADACRSIGIPARLVGCVWRRKPGNHTWVEVWSEGSWYPLGAFEDCPPDKLWFLDDAAAATDEDPRFSIYAARATLNDQGTRFYGWGVPADVVTASYLQKRQDRVIRVHIAAERGGQRVAVPFRVAGESYTTPGPLQDLNDYATVTFPASEAGKTFLLEIGGRTVERRITPDGVIIEQLD